MSRLTGWSWKDTITLTHMENILLREEYNNYSKKYL